MDVHALEFLCLQVLEQNLLLRLDLEQLQQEADEVRRALVAVHAPDEVKLNGLVNKGLGYRPANASDRCGTRNSERTCRSARSSALSKTAPRRFGSG
jgi:hypothetical protein